MKRTPVESSMIQDIGYDPETETLEIGFNSGTVYQYFEVEQETYDAFMKADSKGRYFLDSVEPFYVYGKVGRSRRQ